MLKCQLTAIELRFRPCAAGVEHRHPLTPYDGMTLKGRVLATYLRGERIYVEADGAHRHRAAGPYGKPLLRK